MERKAPTVVTANGARNELVTVQTHFDRTVGHLTGLGSLRSFPPFTMLLDCTKCPRAYNSSVDTLWRLARRQMILRSTDTSRKFQQFCSNQLIYLVVNGYFQ